MQKEPDFKFKYTRPSSARHNHSRRFPERALTALASGSLTCLAIIIIFSQLYGCSTEKPRPFSTSDISGEWNYIPPREYWPNQGFKLKIEQKGERITGKLIPLFQATGNVFDKQVLEGSLVGNQVFFNLRSDNKTIASMLGTLSTDARSIVGSIQYSKEDRFVWSASR